MASALSPSALMVGPRVSRCGSGKTGQGLGDEGPQERYLEASEGPWAWHRLAAPVGQRTLNHCVCEALPYVCVDVVTDLSDRVSMRLSPSPCPDPKDGIGDWHAVLSTDGVE